MPDMNPRPGVPTGVAQGPAFDKLGGFADFIGVQTEGRDREITSSQIVIRYGRFAGFRLNTPLGRPHLAIINIGAGQQIHAHTLEPNLTTANGGDRVILLTWGVAHAVVLGKLHIA